jgi:hypothetical protein
MRHRRDRRPPSPPELWLALLTLTLILIYAISSHVFGPEYVTHVSWLR